MPTTPWARTALYTPGQVWCPEGVSRDDVNPRPLSSIVPSNGLIGCVSADGKELLATAWEPYQELFQGVIVCLHSDFRIGGLKPGESKTIRGKIYLMPADFAGTAGALPPATSPSRSGEAQPEPAGVAGEEAHRVRLGRARTPSFLRGHRAAARAAPFDGCVFHVDARAARGAPAELHLAGLGPAGGSLADDLKPARGRPRVDRAATRFPPQLPPVQHHARRPRLVRRPRGRHRQRPAGRRARPRGPLPGNPARHRAIPGEALRLPQAARRRRVALAEYAAQARRRGREVMAAFQEGFPDLTVFLTFGHSLVWKQSERGKKPLAECPDGLLVPFLDGMIEAAEERTRLVDGHELSYGYRDADAFVHARRDDQTHAAAALAADRAGYARVVSAGFGLWLDYDWRKKGWNTARPDKNYFSPAGFETSLRAALEQSDEYVWIYTEKPRWWSEQKGTIDLPPAYVETVRRVRRALLESDDDQKLVSIDSVETFAKPGAYRPAQRAVETMPCGGSRLGLLTAGSDLGGPAGFRPADTAGDGPSEAFPRRNSHPWPVQFFDGPNGIFLARRDSRLQVVCMTERPPLSFAFEPASVASGLAKIDSGASVFSAIASAQRERNSSMSILII